MPRPASPAPVPEHRPGEPLRARAPAPIFLIRILVNILWIAVLACISAVLLPLSLAGRARWGHPPHLPRLGRVRQRIVQAVTARPPAPGLPLLNRAWVILRAVEKLVASPLLSLAWYTDELLFGAALDAVPVRAPVFLLSAARSGSTQLGHTIEEDPTVVAPVVLQIMFPYLWLWHLVVPTLGRLVTPDGLSRALDRALPLEMRERHEGHPLRTDTFEVLWMTHGTMLSAIFLGPAAMREAIGVVGTAHHDAQAWEQDFVDFLDRVCRKALHFHGPLPDGRPPRLFAKGHFLAARHAVAARFPDAHFLTVLRDPVRRLESMVNHLHGNPVEEPLGAPSWAWITAYLCESEVAYCAVEQAWATTPTATRITVLRFTDFVADLPGTMGAIHRACFGRTTLPDHVPQAHVPRKRSGYTVHRRLDELGVDVPALAARLAGYRAWVAGPQPVATPGGSAPSQADSSAARTDATGPGSQPGSTVTSPT